MNPRIMSYPDVRLVNDFPPFPENTLGLERGSYIHTTSEDIAEKFGLPIGHPIPLCFDGKIIRCSTLGWSIDSLVQNINEGIWEISEQEKLSDELIVLAERQMGGQITICDFWTNLWDAQEEFPEQFRLQTHPDVTADDLKAAASAAGKKLFIHAELEPGEFSQDENGEQTLSMVVGGSDNGALDCTIQISPTEMLSGDRFFLCQITS